MGDTDAHLQMAIDAMNDLEGVTVSAVSPIYRTEPQEKSDQPWFANQVARATCTDAVTAESLLTMLLAIESRLGRDRSTQSHRYGPRVIDLDLLLFGKTVCETAHLTLPHPRMHLRAFVLVPLHDIAPQLVFPNGTTLDETLAALVFRVEGSTIWQ